MQAFTEKRVLRAHSQRMSEAGQGLGYSHSSGATFRRYPRHLCRGDVGQFDLKSLLKWFGAKGGRRNT